MPANGVASDAARWQAPLWGLGRVFALEQPAKWGSLIDLVSDANDAVLAEQVLTAIESDDGEDQIAWRGQERFAARLTSAAAPPTRQGSPLLRADATYLVTGGFGGLGLVIARWLFVNGARSIALLGRNPDAGAPAVRELESLGARVWCLRGDVADESRMTELLRELEAEAPPLGGIMHAAADLSVAPIVDLSAAKHVSAQRSSPRRRA